MGRNRRRRAGPSEVAPQAAGGGPARSEKGRFSSRKKMEFVLRLLRGETVDLVSREAGVTAATLAGWRDEFVAAGQAGLKSRHADPADDELRRLRSKVGSLTMDIEVYEEMFRRRGIEVPFELRRSRR